MIISKDRGKTSDTHSQFKKQNKTLNRLEIEESFLNLIKGI